MNLFQRLRNRLLNWLAAKALVAARQHLEAEHLGQKLKLALEAKTGFPSKVFEKEFATYLRTVADEVSS